MWIAKTPRMHAMRGIIMGVVLGLLPSWALASGFDPPPLSSRFSQVLTVDAYAAGDTLVQDSWGRVETPATAAPAADRHRAFSDLKPARDIGRGLRVLASDTRAVFVAPFHMNGGDALWTAGTLAVASGLYAYDQEVLDTFDRNSENGVYDAALVPGRKLEKLGFIGSTAAYWGAGG